MPHPCHAFLRISAHRKWVAWHACGQAGAWRERLCFAADGAISYVSEKEAGKVATCRASLPCTLCLVSFFPPVSPPLPNPPPPTSPTKRPFGIGEQSGGFQRHRARRAGLLSRVLPRPLVHPSLLRQELHHACGQIFRWPLDSPCLFTPLPHPALYLCSYCLSLCALCSHGWLVKQRNEENGWSTYWEY